jgi:hypothetical protein
MDVGFKLEHVLRHLDHTEPDMEHWQKMGDSRSTEIEGILVNAGSFNNSAEHMLCGLVLAAHLLAKSMRKSSGPRHMRRARSASSKESWSG